MSTSNVFEIERPWGNFRQFILNEQCTVKIITVKPEEMLSLQSHNKRAEFWHIIGGDGIVEIGENKKETKMGDEHEIKIGEKHRLTGGKYGIQVLEIAKGEFDENDVTHYEDKYGRV